MKALKAATSAAGTTEPGAWAFYLGGPGHNGGNGSTYTNAFLDQLEASGVVLLPIFVGRQKELSHDRGVADAAAALVLHKQFHSRNTMIVTDIEQNTSAGKTASAPKRKAAVAYVEGWTKALNDKGFQAMVYGSFVLAADLAEFADPKPDAIWVARYRTHKADKSHLAHSIPGVPNNAFVGRRAWQYGGAFADHPNLNKEKTPAVAGGLVCDISVVHAAVFDGTGNKPTKTTKTTKKTPTKATKGGGTPPVAKPPKGIHVIASGETLSASRTTSDSRTGGCSMPTAPCSTPRRASTDTRTAVMATSSFRAPGWSSQRARGRPADRGSRRAVLGHGARSRPCRRH